MSWKTPGEVRARTNGTKSPSRSEALHFIDSSKSPSTNIDGSLVNFRRRLSNRHGRPRRMLIWRFGAVGSSPDFSRGFSRHGASRTSFQSTITARDSSHQLTTAILTEEEKLSPALCACLRAYAKLHERKPLDSLLILMSLVNFHIEFLNRHHMCMAMGLLLTLLISSLTSARLVKPAGERVWRRGDV